MKRLVVDSNVLIKWFIPEDYSEYAIKLRKGNERQAAKKLWDTAVLTVKAYAYWRDGRRLSSHGELWEYKRKLEEEFGEWVHDAWMNATSMHGCFYESWCVEKDIEKAYKRMEKLVKEVTFRIKDSLD